MAQEKIEVFMELSAQKLHEFFLYFRHIKILIFLCLPFVLSSCIMYMPAARDDFTTLGQDVFSNLIREAHVNKGVQPSCFVGVCQINKVKADAIATQIMVGQTIREVKSLFEREGGSCQPTTSTQVSDLMTCDVTRKWRLKNIGATIATTEYWARPAAKLEYQFAADKTTSVVKTVTLEIFDVTEHKPITFK